MPFQRTQKPYTFTDGRQVVVHEANWDIAAERDRIIDDALAQKSQGGDSELLYFQEIYYSYLAPCSSGDVPDLLTAFHLPPDDLDGWYQAVIDTNPSWFLKVDRSFQEVIKFRGGLRLTVVSGLRPSSVMRRMHLELEAKRATGSKDRLDVFRWYIYPRLAGCTRGAVPSADELRREWPETEIYRWTDVARRGTPTWFSSPQQAAEQVQAETLQTEKKKDKRRKRS